MTASRGLRLKKLADKTDLAALDDDLPGAPPGTWPLAGVKVLGEAPRVARMSLQFVQRARQEGWLTLEGDRLVQRPSGPADNPAGDLHTFTHADAIVLHTVDGDVRYRVVHQPDKYHADGDDLSVTDAVYRSGDTRVDWHFVGELEG